MRCLKVFVFVRPRTAAACDVVFASMQVQESLKKNARCKKYQIDKNKPNGHGSDKMPVSRADGEGKERRGEGSGEGG